MKLGGGADDPVVDWPADDLTAHLAELEGLDLAGGKVRARINLVNRFAGGVVRLEEEAEPIRLAMLSILLATAAQRRYLQVFAPTRTRQGRDEFDEVAARAGRVGSISMGAKKPAPSSRAHSRLTDANQCLVTDVRATGGAFGRLSSKLLLRLVDVDHVVHLNLTAAGLAKLALAATCYASDSAIDVRSLLIDEAYPG